MFSVFPLSFKSFVLQFILPFIHSQSLVYNIFMTNYSKDISVLRIGKEVSRSMIKSIRCILPPGVFSFIIL